MTLPVQLVEVLVEVLVKVAEYAFHNDLTNIARCRAGDRS